MIQDGKIRISERQLVKLVDKYGQEGTIQRISDLIDENKIPLPLYAPTQEQADEAHQRLCDMDAVSLFRKGNTQTRYPSDAYPLSRHFIDSSTVGGAASNIFHHNARMHCDSVNSPSPFRVWWTPKFRQSALKAIFSLKHAHVDCKVLGQCIALRKYIASQFRPSAAKALYEKFAPEGQVLDMSSGWGDRLEGFMASSAVRYVGFDPNVHVHEGYARQMARYKRPDQSAQIHYLPFEKAELPSGEFDLAFTSPPYFNIERYSKDEGQSYMRYKTCDEWLKKFLFPFLTIAYESLRPGGRLIVNIADVYSGHTVNRLCDPLNDFMRTKLKAKQRQHFGYRMAKRVGSASDSRTPSVFVEPCWHWQKV